MEEYYGNNDYRDYLMHYGVLGMRWGVRRYQPYSVRGRKSGKGGVDWEARRNSAARSKKAVDSIIDTMTVKERREFGMEAGDKEYLTIDQGEHVIHRELKTKGKTPVAFFDLLDDGDEIQLALGTRRGSEYRGKGYAKECATKAMVWLEKHPEVRKNRDVIWGVKVNNKGSIAIAKSLNFKKDPTSLNKGWINYINKG